MVLKQKSSKIFYGWWIVGACVLANSYTAGVIFFGFTAIFEPIANEFGWSYAQVSLAASLRGLEMGILAPLTGMLVDRWGPRKIMFVGTFIAGTGLILLSRITSLGMFYAVFVLIAVGTSTCGSTVIITAVAHWFRRRVTIATGLVVSGFALGGLLVPLVARLIDVLGWRTAIAALGIGMWLIPMLLSLFVRHKPEQYGYLPDGDSNEVMNIDTPSETVASMPGTELDIPPRRALLSRPFWHITLSATYQAFAVSAIVTHIMPYLSSINIARSISSLMASATPVMSISGRMGFGWLGDKFDKRAMSAIGFLLMSLGLLFFALVPTLGIWSLVLFIVVFGIGWGGAVPMRPALLREYFGRSKFGTILGSVFGVMMVGQILGAPLAGWWFDTWGSYQGVWFIFAGLGVAAMIIMLTIPSLNKSKLTD
jgi:MFS family permease